MRRLRKLLGSVQPAIEGRRMPTRRISCAVFLLAVSCCTVAGAQQRSDPDSKVRTSDLAQQNLNQVAASATEVKAILTKDEGLMVELKRWVAKDATEHGQIVGETELSDYAILNRIDTDVQFRAVATLLLQKYGYLVARVNPESELAKQQELLTAERTKWIAQEEEQERAEAQQRAAQEFEKRAACGEGAVQQIPCSGAANQPPEQLSQEQGRQDRQTGTEPLIIAPPDQNVPNSPLAPSFNLPRTQLVQMGGGALDGAGSSDAAGLGSLGGGLGQLAGGGRGLGGFAGADGESTGSASGQIASALGGSSGLGNGLPQQSFGAGSEMGMSAGLNGIGGAGMDFSAGLLSNLGQSNDYGSPGSGSSLLVPLQPNRKYPNLTPIEQPQMVRRASPYANVPSLVDMYIQAVAQPSTPKRFGEVIFENGTRDLELIPMDLPAGPDYVVGPGDGLSIDLTGGISQRLVRTVDRAGQVSLPEVGPVLVSGKSLAAVQEDVQQALRSQFHNVTTGVSLSRLRTIRIYEVGDLVNPGAYDISSLSTPLNALFIAGGPSSRGSLRMVNHYRDGQLIQTVDLYDLLLHGVKTNIERLENGDTVQIPPVGPQITIEGMVRRPAIYELRDEKTLASVLELAGGVLPAAALRHVEVERLVAHEKRTMLSLDIPEGSDASEVTKQLEAFQIQDGDRIRIYPIAPYNQDAIYLDGHVVRPGRYSYRSGMRVTEIIASYKDLLPEPAAEYAEIIRLNAPDFRPSVESFNLAEALADPSKAPVLQPMDTIRIFGRFDFENPPEVDVMGEVRAPGQYKTAGQIRLADAIHLAGGLTPDAKTADAQVFRYLPDGKFQIFSVSLGQALAGDATENILLAPRDRLLIHRNPDAIESATVYVEGDVSKPGRYPLTTNMHVADLIRIGGGLKPSADTEFADLTTYGWSNGARLAGQQQRVSISGALAGETNANVPLSNGDVLTIRQLSGWNDLGASISVKGEVKHPGTYGIRPGERLSSVLARAGGFEAESYPYGAVLERAEVRDLEAKEHNDMILRVRQAQSGIAVLPDGDAQQRQSKALALEQWQSSLDTLNENPPVGRVAIRISSDINRWKNTVADVEVRSGDVLVVPKKPDYVLVAGQVFNPTAVSYRPGRSAEWYVSQSGGPTPLANKRAVFVVRADGSVLGDRRSLWSGESLNAALQPGDTVVVPEKAYAGTVQWQNLLLSAQVAASITSALFIALHP